MYKNDGYTVLYDANGGTGKMEPQICFASQMYKTQPSDFERVGYTFSGWNTAANGSGTNYEIGQNFTNLGGSGSQVKLYAQWQPISSTITYDFNDGVNFQQVNYSPETNLVLAEAPARGNYTFENWVVTATDFGSWQLGTTFTAGQTLGKQNFGDVRLTALWKRISTPLGGKNGDKNVPYALQNGSQLRFFGVENNAKVQLFDVAGRCLLAGTLADSTLFIGEIPTGIYLCKTENFAIKVLINNDLR